MKIITDCLSAKEIFSRNKDSLSLHNISNGKVSSPSINSYLLNVKENEDTLMSSFIDKRLVKKRKSFCDILPCYTLENFKYEE